MIGRANQAALLLASILILSERLYAEDIRQGSASSCSLAVAPSGNVTIACNSASLSEYEETIRTFSQLVNRPSADLQAIREYIGSHLELIDGNYVAPRLDRAARDWTTARQTFYNPPFKSGGSLKPDFAIIDYMGAYSNKPHKLTLIFLGPTNDSIFLENGDPSPFNRDATVVLLHRLTWDIVDSLIRDLERLDRYRLPPMAGRHFDTEVLVIAGRRGAIPKQYLSKMRELNADKFYDSRGGFITYDTFLERLVSRRL